MAVVLGHRGHCGVGVGGPCIAVRNQWCLLLGRLRQVVAPGRRAPSGYSSACCRWVCRRAYSSASTPWVRLHVRPCVFVGGGRVDENNVP